jgi:raffinose/stachyose/melibiose transport system substrate-binding protein
MKKVWLASIAAATAFLTACTGSGGSGTPPSRTAVVVPSGSGGTSSISGNITYLSHRTDLDKDGTYKKYIAEFNKTYPNVHVTIQSDTNYDNDTVTKLNSGTVPDVLDIPAQVPREDLPRYFQPFGTVADLSQKYNWVGNYAYDNQVFGLATFGNLVGMVVNLQVWSKAGIDLSTGANWPKSPDEFLSDLKAIKAKEPGVMPYYTNYHDGWPTNWNNALGSISCNADANNRLTQTDAPWSPLPAGSDEYVPNKLLYDVVDQKLVEKDPTTTNWENSKTLIAKGQIGTMFLGSWAVPQFQLAATTAGADPNNIGMIPFPFQVNGKWCPQAGPDTNIGISAKTKHAQAAAAWIYFLVNQSGMTASNNGLPTLKSGAFPSGLAKFKAPDIDIITLDASKAADVTTIDNKAKIGIAAQQYPQHIIDLARGAAGGSLQSYFNTLNKTWASARKATDDGTKQR